MIINLGNISYEICPGYPEHFNVPGDWDGLIGEYQFAQRLSCNEIGNFTGSKFSIYKEDYVLVMSDPFGPILPMDDDYLIIMSGPFAGETIEYNSETGNLIHQNAVFVPVGLTYE